jgi:hypothetical protein
MIAWMFYAAVVTALLALAASAGEPLQASRGAPRRWLWVVALLGGAAMGLGAPLIGHAGVADLPPAGALATTALTPHAGEAANVPPDAGESAQSWLAASRRYDASARLIWLLMSGVAALLLLGSAVRLRRLRRNSRHRRVKGVSIVTTAARGPAAAGVISPWLILPDWLGTLPRAERRMLRAHELEHVRARDPLLKLVGALMLVLMPWNVAAWWAVRRLVSAIELDCDARVVARCGDARGYARFLLDIAASTRRVPALAVGEVSLVGDLERRVDAMTRKRSMSWTRRSARFGVAAAAVALVFALDAPERPVHAGTAAGDVVTAVIPEYAPNAVTSAAPGLQTGTIMGLVLDQNDQPVAGASVTLVQPRMGTLTNGSGRFLLINVPAGEYVVQISAAGYRSQQVERVRVNDGMMSPLKITLSRTGQPSIPAVLNEPVELPRVPTAPGAPTAPAAGTAPPPPAAPAVVPPGDAFREDMLIASYRRITGITHQPPPAPPLPDAATPTARVAVGV